MNIFSHTKKKQYTHVAKSIFWFFIGVFLGLFLLLSFLFIIFQRFYANVVYPGVFINNTHFGGKTPKQIQEYFKEKNALFDTTQFIFTSNQQTATISAKSLQLGFDENLLANQAYSIGRSNDLLSNISLILQAYTNNIYLQPSYHYDEAKLEQFILPIAEKLQIDPINAVFVVENGRVTTFRPSSNGQEIDREKIKNEIAQQVPKIAKSANKQTITIPLPLETIKPDITTEKVNNLGITELIGIGTSLFQGSIPSRIYNVNLGASRINGAIIAPGEEFSFDKTVGDVSSLTGYKQAYVIQNGKTILGDGGGICQVSTTLFRAALNAGLPITERHAHAYRVHYYEENSPPGIDATIYTPTVDLKFRNDTGKYILIQSIIDLNELRLTLYLYGTKDNRQVIISDPVIVSESPAPETLYQDDPTLPKGTLKQVDFSAPGANIYFTRQVKKDGKVTIDEKFTSNFKPWQAVFLRGTKE